MAKKSLMSKVGVWSYIAGILIAAILGLVATFGTGSIQGWHVAVLGILGVIVGLLNISDDEVQMFLVAAIAFVVASSGMAVVFNSLGDAFVGLEVFMNAIAIFTAPGALVVAFKALYNVAKDD